MIKRLSSWWQAKTGVDDTPFDGNSTAFVTSLVVHLGLLIALGLIPMWARRSQLSMDLIAPVIPEEEQLEITETFYFGEQPTMDMGANSEQGTEMAQSQAAVIAESIDIPHPEDMEPFEVGEVVVNNHVAEATGKKFNENMAVKGHVGVGTTGAEGAIDRITHEIMLSLEERRTLVVWLFDQSGSLSRQRKTIVERFNRIYDELGVIEATGNKAFSKHASQPLLTSVYAFGKEVSLLTKKPTANLAEIKENVRNIQQDDSGIENVFTAVFMAVSRYKSLRRPSSSGDPERNLMLIIVSDEVGNDQDGLDTTVKACRRLEIPVYCIGVPAPFGRRETLVKWVDPDPKYDQSPQWGRVSQGPESLLPERVKLHFAGSRPDDVPIDSGFGPFALTRLCYETGGMYFAVHPNRNVNRSVTRRDTKAFSAHLKHFFDPQVMRKYRPEYVSTKEYLRRVNNSKLRSSLMNTAQTSWVSPMEEPTLRFVKRDEATFNQALSVAQQDAAKLEPQIDGLYQMLKLGESDRDKEASLRWQAGFDLAMGRILAVRARTQAYNAMLALAKRGMKFKTPKNNTWILTPADEISVGSKLANDAKRAKEYLHRLIKEHPGTPWALLAERELKTPVGWKWVEEYTNLNPTPRRAANNNNNNNPRPAQNERRKMLPKPKPSASHLGFDQQNPALR